MAQITHNHSTFLVGQVAAIVAATQLPDVPAKRVLLRASTDTVHVGPDSTVSDTTGFPMETDHEPLELFVGNLNEIWVTSATGSVSWLVQR